MKFTFQPEATPLGGYTIKRAIDRGGFGEVYYAVSDAGKEVALKLLRHNMDVELRGVSQCLNLKHPNLVTLFDIRQDADGDSWVVMEYVAGQNLERILAEHPSGLPLEQSRRWLQGASQGLAFLHDRGIVHRDVKPGNLFMDQGVVKVGDVGLSKAMTPSRRSAHTESVGTVYYMAPEVAHGRYGPEVDVYSLGIILYEMLTGRVPFEGESTGEILLKHLSQPPDLSLVPERLRLVLAGALAKDPALRTRSVKTLAEEFERAVQGLPLKRGTPVAVQIDSSGAGPALANGGGRVDQMFEHISKGLAARRLEERRGFLERHWLVAIVACLLMLLVTPRSVLGGVIVLGLTALLFLLARSLMTVFAETIAPASPLGPATSRGAAVRVAPSNLNTAPIQVDYRRPAPPPRPPQVPRREQRAHRRPLTPHTVRIVSWRQRMADLSGSLAAAPVLAAVFTMLAGFLTPLFEDKLTGAEFDAGRAGLFGLTTLVGAWGILLFAKLAEGRAISASSRRLGLLALGIGIGSAAYWFDQALMVDLVAPNARAGSSMFHQVGRQPLLDMHTQPTWLGYAVFFGALLGLRRWWAHADAFRSKKFRVGSLLVTVGLALVLPVIWAFPVSWAVTWAAAISCVVQLSAPWISDGQRSAFLEVQSHAV